MPDINTHTMRLSARPGDVAHAATDASDATVADTALCAVSIGPDHSMSRTSARTDNRHHETRNSRDPGQRAVEY